MKRIFYSISSKMGIKISHNDWHVLLAGCNFLLLRSSPQQRVMGNDGKCGNFIEICYTWTLFALLLIIRFTPPGNALLVFLQGKFVITALFSTCLCSILSSFRTVWSTIPIIGTVWVLQLLTNLFHMLSKGRVLTFIIVTFMYCLQLKNLSFVLLLFCRF